MTENAARSLLHLSPTGDACKLILYIGKPRAMKLVSNWIRELAKMTPLPLSALAFWTDVALRLSGLQLSRKCEPNFLRAADRTRYESMLALVGMRTGKRHR